MKRFSFRRRRNAKHDAADQFEPRVKRAMVVAFERASKEADWEAFIAAVGAGNVAGAVGALCDNLEDTLSPIGGIIGDVVMRGGKVGADEINEALK